MKTLQVTVTDKVTVDYSEDIGSGNVNSIRCIFTLPESFNGLLPIATFKKDGTVYNRAIVNNECYVPHEVLEETGYVYFGVYAYEQVEDTLKLRVSPVISGFGVSKGSYMGEGQESTTIEPSDFELYVKALNDIKDQAQQIIDDFSAEDVVFLDGETFQQKYERGDLDGPQGIQGIQGETGNSGVHYGNEEPIDPLINVWVDPDAPYSMEELIDKYNKNAEVKEQELNAIVETARDIVGATTFTTIDLNFETGNLEVNNAESLANMGFQCNYETGNLEVDIDG